MRARVLSHQFQILMMALWLSAPRVFAGQAAPWDAGARTVLGWFNSPTVIVIAAIALIGSLYAYFSNDSGVAKRAGGIGMAAAAIPLMFSLAGSFFGAQGALIP